MDLSCKKCHYIISKEWYFCPNCGRKLKRRPLSTSILTQIGLYLTCLLFPPFGLIPGMRYLLQKRAGAAVIGSICIVLTIIATAVTLLVAQKMYVNLQKQIDQQMQYYNELGI
jgi:hypothetical protein